MPIMFVVCVTQAYPCLLYDFDDVRFVLVPEHELFLELAAVVHRAFGPLELFDSVCVPERVERVFAGALSRRHVADHDRLAVPWSATRTDEGVFEHQRELAAAEWRVLLVLVQRADAWVSGAYTL